MPNVKGPKKRRRYIKVRVEGGSVVLTVGSAIPLTWKLVEIIEKPSKDGKRVMLEIVRIA